jgi:hypothetical protein
MTIQPLGRLHTLAIRVDDQEPPDAPGFALSLNDACDGRGSLLSHMKAAAAS